MKVLFIITWVLMILVIISIALINKELEDIRNEQNKKELEDIISKQEQLERRIGDLLKK